MTSMRSDEATMPVFTASGRMSVKTASISFARKSAEASIMSLTPHVFCAVSAVTADMANTPFTVIVLMSA